MEDQAMLQKKDQDNQRCPRTKNENDLIRWKHANNFINFIASTNFLQDVACNAGVFGERAHLDKSSAILDQTRKRLGVRRKCVLGSGS